MLEKPMDADYSKGEMDAVMKAAGSDRLKGMEVSGRKVAPDGKSGMISFSDPNAKNERWDPKFVVTPRELDKRREQEDVVLAYFMSSAEDEMGQSHTNGKAFEEAAQRLLESENQVSCLMVDINKFNPAEWTSEFGVVKAHSYVLFKGGLPSSYKGRLEADGIVAYMTANSGPPYTKLAASDLLDAALEEAKGTAETVVIGVLGPAYEGLTSRNFFQKAALDLRDPLRLSFIEVSPRTANGCKLFAKGSATGGDVEPFTTEQSAFVVVHPANWVTKGEPRYYISFDFRKIFSFVQSHAFPMIAPFSEQFIKHVQKYPVGSGKQLLATYLIDMKALASKQRYIVKQMHKLIAAEPEVAATYAFAVGERQPLHPFFAERFDRTTVNTKFYGRFHEEFEGLHKDFTVIIANLTSAQNWLSTEMTGATPEGLETVRLGPLLKSIAAGKVPQLPQGSAAAEAAGLKEMSLGFGGDGGGMSMGGDMVGKKKRKKGKRKSKTATSGAKDEV
eukprot:CAMPEP_0119327392 /NCGR_PEP_ID=MMETSP1333-20130426/70667_1 /TAXON_ID=418940 /ORGANISM="Scyphosphaera apsteinii, Strain RCC1455" /LENGTH=503 /DNA_ID=CAMNT_0007335971 /DNA_START=184 /DNA_END=1695 /DNA_ORIENTATION=+